MLVASELREVCFFMQLQEGVCASSGVARVRSCSASYSSQSEKKPTNYLDDWSTDSSHIHQSASVSTGWPSTHTAQWPASTTAIPNRIGCHIKEDNPLFCECIQAYNDFCITALTNEPMRSQNSLSCSWQAAQIIGLHVFLLSECSVLTQTII